MGSGLCEIGEYANTQKMLDFKGNIIFQPLGLGSRFQTLPDFLQLI